MKSARLFIPHVAKLATRPAARLRRFAVGSLVFAGIASALAATDSRQPVTIAQYDEHLCREAQQFLINSTDPALPIREQRAVGNGFHVIQMDVETEPQQVVIAMTTAYADMDGANLATYVSCKMVDRARVNDTLGLNLPEPDRQCREVNEQTFAYALANLTAAERSRYLSEGRPLTFGDDVILATGGEWLPATMDAYVQVAEPPETGIVVQSPTVRVPWDRTERQFFQGTQHCKLITLAAMDQWMRDGAFAADALLLPATTLSCAAPHSITSTVGSCRFYFGPADAVFCQDYSGGDWNRDSAGAECATRHASADALRAAGSRYAGTGGLFSTSGCASRADAAPISGSCVFHCQQGDETLWHISGAVDERMTRGCDLFIHADSGDFQ